MPTQFQGEFGTIYVRNVPAVLENMFHAACVRRGQTKRDTVIALMRLYVKREGRLDLIFPGKVKKKKAKRGGPVKIRKAVAV